MPGRILRVLALLALLAACAPIPPQEPTMTQPNPTRQLGTPTAVEQPTGAPVSLNVIPRPVSARAVAGEFVLTPAAAIFVDPPTEELNAIAGYLAEKLRPATGYPLPVAAGPAAPGGIQLTTSGADATLGDEGYALTAGADGVRISAPHPAGLFRGVQTLRQLFPQLIDSHALQPAAWKIAGVSIRDTPRYAWRGAMLDVSRHFFSVADVKTYIDLLAYYKMNIIHLHLSDDQGWRLAINAWPRLAEYGGSTQVGGGTGGYYTQAEYADLVSYAAARYMTLVPEIDLPGHTNAALAAYPELNCSGEAPALYTGIQVGFSSLCIQKEITYHFLDEVIGEIAALTPGPYIHIGGDEAHSTPTEEYITFIEKVQQIVAAHGKQVIGWEEIGQGKLLPGTLAQHWNIDPARSYFSSAAALQGARIIASPADRAYLDMKYDDATPLGQDWAGTTTTRASYGWDPAGQLPGVPGNSILGVEAPIWSETLVTLQNVEFMAFPRMLGIAEIGWSPAGLSWEEYQPRLGSQAPRLQLLGVNFYRDPSVPWLEITPAPQAGG